MRRVGWESGGFASGKGSPNTACIGGGEACASAIKTKPDVRAAAGRARRFVARWAERFVSGEVGWFTVAAAKGKTLLSCPWVSPFALGARSKSFIRMGT